MPALGQARERKPRTGFVYLSVAQKLVAEAEDVMARHRAEERLREAETMEVIGRLACGVAHDFNNLLTGILLYCDLMAASLPRRHRLRRHIAEIRMAGEHGAALTQHLLAVARQQALKPQPTLLNDVVSSTQNLLGRLIGEHIELVIAIRPDLEPVLADPARLCQVLLNLVLNARDAMPKGGRIGVSTFAATFPGTTRRAAGLAVQDSGCGMDSATRARIFDPLFTQKESGRGTGLGLATVRRIVDECHGAIEVRSEPGSGSCIEVFFPLVTDAASISTQSVSTGDLP